MTDFELMGLALEEARKAAALGEVPVGAVVARRGEVVAAAHNTRETEKNALHHAELLAIDAACKKLGGWRLWECELFVTLEPCPMCAGAILNSRVRRVVYGAADAKAGCCGSVTDLFAMPFNHHPVVESGLRAEAAQALLQAAGQPTPDWDMEPSYTLTIAPPGSTVMNERQITNAILTASGGEITQATAVYLDDTLLYVTTEGNHLRSFLDNVKAAWRTPAGGTVGFVHDLQLVDGIYLTASVSGYKDVLAGLLASAGTLQTKVVTHDTYTQPIDYETQTVPDDSLPFGQMVVVQEGQPGSRYVTYETTTVNGEVTDMQIIGISTVNDAVPQIVHEGTRLENGMIGKLGTGTFIWPVPNYRHISRWANLNRGSRGYHQGVDIAAPSGTPIYASDAGTVITAEYHHHPQSWGNYVVIDHGNGYKTLYAHMTNYVVQMGDTVEQGQLIGYVGSTGYSFGSHCHFEMYRDGTLFSAKEVFPDMPTWNPNFTK